jgi:hypothetical protein
MVFNFLCPQYSVPIDDIDCYEFGLSIEKRRNQIYHQTRHLTVLPSWYSIFCVRSIQSHLIQSIVISLVNQLRSGAIDFKLKHDTWYCTPVSIQFFVSAVLDCIWFNQL